jgi:hypothetical protein
MSKIQTLGALRILTPKYVEIQKHILDDPPNIKNLNDSKSILNDKGKIRYLYVIEVLSLRIRIIYKWKTGIFLLNILKYMI